MIGNIRKILSNPTKVVERMNRKEQFGIVLNDKYNLSNELLLNSYVITGIRVRFIYGPTVDRLNIDQSPIAEYSLENKEIIKLIPSLSRNIVTCCNEQVDHNVSTVNIIQYNNMLKLRDHLSRSHSDRFKPTKLRPEDRYFKAWYALELVGANLLTNQEMVMTISNTYWNRKLNGRDILNGVQSLKLEEALSLFSTGINQ